MIVFKEIKGRVKYSNIVHKFDIDIDLGVIELLHLHNFLF